MKTIPPNFLRIYSGDARVWMSIAAELYERNMKALPIRLDRSPQANEINVANVCLGFAFELAYKALFEVSKEKPHKATHRLREMHENLDRPVKDAVERIITKYGWNDIDEFLDHFDKELRHEDSRYWKRPRPPATGVAKVQFWHGYTGTDTLAIVHNELLDYSESLFDRDTGKDPDRTK